ncbi:unnamed protein product [Rotaria sp. Silwood2]|nr:unnamed protein product [Rotaria sp. Silwood2]CAF4488725.1 unnamed protein product [Rotaria sp. Silwood2]
MTRDDDHDELFLATSTSIEVYYPAAFNFSKRYNLNKGNIYSLRFKSLLYFFCLVKHFFGTYKIKYHIHGPDHEPVEIDFTPPYKRIYLL